MTDVDDNNRTPEHRKKIQDRARIAALLSEREGYKRRGLEDRLADVDSALKDLGYREDKDKDGDHATTRAVPKTERS